jgi:hypothetical protein
MNLLCSVFVCFMSGYSGNTVLKGTLISENDNKYLVDFSEGFRDLQRERSDFCSSVRPDNFKKIVIYKSECFQTR